jgi:hypothetical protein
MNFLDRSLPWFWQWLITCLLSAVYFSKLCLLKFCVQISSLQLPPPLVCSEHSVLSAACPFQFLFYYSAFFCFFCRAGVSLSRELYWFIPGVAVGIPLAAYLLNCWSASPKQVWIRCLAAWEPSCFLSVTWCREALYRLGGQGLRVLPLLGGFFLPRVAIVSQQDFWLTELTLSAFSL